MTDPTADAIAALEELAVRLGIAVADDHAVTIGPPKARYYVNALRSALLSAQGQAGKPQAWLVTYPDPEELVVCLSEARALEYADGDRSDVHPLYVQPQPAAGLTAALTVARTALEAAEKALQRLATETRFNQGDGFAWASDELVERRAFANTAQSACTVALATIKRLES